MPMHRHFDEELKELKKKLLRLGGMVEEGIVNAIKSLVERDSELAHKTIDADHNINALEVEIDEDCIRLMALHQPAAKDLRLLTTTLKLIDDLERMGDLAVNICERALELNKESTLKPYTDIPRMAVQTQQMVKECLDAFINEDVELAYKVCDEDELIDDLNTQILRELITFMAEDPTTISRAMRVIFVSKNLERIADHAVNISQSVVYMVKGKVIRHTISSHPENQ